MAAAPPGFSAATRDPCNFAHFKPILLVRKIPQAPGPSQWIFGAAPTFALDSTAHPR